MKTKLFLFLVLLTKVLSMAIPNEDTVEIESTITPATATRAGSSTPGMVVYLPNYTLGSTIELEKFDFTYIDVVIYCFFRLDSEGNAYSINESVDFKHQTMEKLNTTIKKKYPKLRTILSFGGDSGSKNLGTVLSTDERIKAASKSIANTMKKYGFDGIDIDWEFPKTEVECENLYKFIKKIRSYIGDTKLLTLSSSATASKYKGHLGSYVKYVDWFNVMTYNYAGEWNKVSGHNDPLYTFTDDLNKQKSVDTTVSDYEAEGVPDSKIVIGASFSGKIWKVNSSDKNGLNQAGSFVGPINYKNIRTENILSSARTPVSPWVRTWYNDVKSPTLYNKITKQYITYCDTDAVCERAAYAKKRKLGGLMVWELGQDYNRELINSAIYFFIKY
jgi:chitinase